MKNFNYLIISLLIVVSLSLSTYSQNVGIGTNFPRSRALLDLHSNNLGLLLPRVDRSLMTGLTLQDNGLIVFDTTIGNQGLWLWNGTSWGSVSVFGSQAANTVFAAPAAATGLPFFRQLVADDIPNLNTSKLTAGILPIIRGGTNGTAVPTSGGIAYGTGTSYAFTPAGTVGQVLQSNGAAAPGWVTLPSAGWLLAGNSSTTAADFLGTTDNRGIRFRTNNVQRMTLDSLGRLGIGNTTPWAPLQFATNEANRKIVLWQSLNNDHQYYGFGVNNGILRYQVNNTGNHIFYASTSETESKELMRMQSTGYVRIGTAGTNFAQVDVLAPNTEITTGNSRGALNVFASDSGVINMGAAITLGGPIYSAGGTIRAFASIEGRKENTNDNNSRGYLIFKTNDVGGFGTMIERMRVTSNGRIGIGTDAPSTLLDVNGQIRIRGGSPAAGRVLTSTADGTATWDNAIPAGGIIMWSGSIASIPSGWALCDGTNGTPNLSGRFIVGYQAGAATTPTNVTTGKEINYGAVNNTGGTNLHTLAATEMPSHNHTGTTATSGAHTHTGTTNSAGAHTHTGTTNSAGAHTHTYEWFQGVGTLQPSGLGAGSSNTRNTSSAGAHTHGFTTDSGGAHTHGFTTNSGGDHTHTFTSNNTGGGLSHENRPPYYVLAFIMKLN